MARVYLGRLPFRARESDIERFFQGYGKITDIAMKRGFAFIEFESKRDAEDAVDELNGRSILGDRGALMEVMYIAIVLAHALEIASDEAALALEAETADEAGRQGEDVADLAAEASLQSDVVQGVIQAAPEVEAELPRRNVVQGAVAEPQSVKSVLQRVRLKKLRAEALHLRKEEVSADPPLL
ncbi:unnamed protein product [Haemonchus placei]|uniref:RRM domain-containing protein n=1 Tax=Haemonchus placei TaxID=6290 RepID=A0A0N4WFC6_HAEPC|nr:unnamed protein product [Haemonchus placei]